MNQANNKEYFKLPLIGFVGYSGSGKTTLLKKIIAIMSDKGIRIGLVKHAHHHFDIDLPGKDSYELRQAGASQVLVASTTREALIIEKKPSSQQASEKTNPMLFELLTRLDTEKLDLIFVEGFKHEQFDKIEVSREANKKPFLYDKDQDIMALVTDRILENKPSIPVLSLNKTNDIIAFISARYKLV